MGEFLSTPIKEKQSEDGETTNVLSSIYNPKVKIWGIRNARLEKKNGRLSYF